MKRLAILLLFIVSCTPQQRLQRLLAKHPDLLKDSIYYHTDTIIKPGIVFDTIRVVNSIDSIVIDTGGVNVKVYRIYDTLRVKLKTRTDTVFVKSKDTVRYVNEGKQKNNITYILIGAVFTLFLIVILKK